MKQAPPVYALRPPTRPPLQQPVAWKTTSVEGRLSNLKRDVTPWALSIHSSWVWRWQSLQMVRAHTILLRKAQPPTSSVSAQMDHCSLPWSAQSISDVNEATHHLGYCGQVLGPRLFLARSHRSVPKTSRYPIKTVGSSSAQCVGELEAGAMVGKQLIDQHCTQDNCHSHTIAAKIQAPVELWPSHSLRCKSIEIFDKKQRGRGSDSWDKLVENTSDGSALSNFKILKIKNRHSSTPTMR